VRKIFHTGYNESSNWKGSDSLNTNTDKQYTNNLIKEKSPYLLQHAHNPVNWYPWGEEAFEKAKAENKPIFLSIGYSTCHWCHVMERESFEDEEVANVLNNHYVAIKVDREERPDVDHIYMTVCQAMTGHGGWPLTIIMTPEKKPFFAGTYFPKVGRRGLSGMMDILPYIAKKWLEDQEALIDSSNRIADAVQPRFKEYTSGEVDDKLLHRAFSQLEKQFDSTFGGFNRAPKFPIPHQYMFLLRYWKKTNNNKPLLMVEKSLEAMHQGGIYDHIGFGFARYSTDDQWLVPHFEKMLYDNALLAYTYLEAYQATKKEPFARIAEEIFTYVLRDMQHEEGGFYSAEDADSEGIEGKFYVWTPKEVKEILGEEEGELFCQAYDITDRGNFEGKSIPNLINQSFTYLAHQKGINEEELRLQLGVYRDQLFQAREKRIHPHKDDKILTAWNGLMIAALAKGAQALNRQEYSETSDRAIRFVLNKLRKEDGRLLARYREGEAAYLAYLDDYAFFIWGLIEQYEATYHPEYLKVALELNQQMKALFWDDKNGGYFFYGEDGESLLARPKELYDGAQPSGNSVAALNLLRLSSITGHPQLEQDAMMLIKAFAGTVKQYPAGYTFFLTALQYSLGPTKEIVIAGKEEDQKTVAMLNEVRSRFLPEAVVLFHKEKAEGISIEEIAPYTKEQEMVNDQATAYVCENFACHSPTNSLEEFLELI